MAQKVKSKPIGLLMDNNIQFTLYSSPQSQWANVPQLGLAEKGYNESEYDVKNLDLRS